MKEFCCVCLRSATHTMLTLRNMCDFYALWAREEISQETHSWLCAFCWVRVSQCIKFIDTAKNSKSQLSKKYSFIQQTALHSYVSHCLPNINICACDECGTEKMLQFETVTLQIPISLTEQHFEKKGELDIEFDKEEKPSIKEEKDSIFKTCDIDSWVSNNDPGVSESELGKNEDEECSLPAQSDFKLTWPELLEEEEENGKTLGLNLVHLTEEEQQKEMEKKKQRTRYKNAVYKCEQCAHICKDENYLAKHVNIHHVETIGLFECSICHYRFKTLLALSQHKLDQHERRWLCNSCGALVTRQHWPIHGTNCSPEGTHECDVCHRKYKTKKRLRFHKNRTHSDAGVTCDICKKTFTFKYQLLTHIRTHTGEKPYECEECNKKYTSMGCLMIHTKEKHAPPLEEPLEERYCVECDKKFKNKKGLERHLQSSLHVDPTTFKFACHLCSKKFTSPFLKEQHIKQTHVQNKDLPCPLCDKMFSVKIYLNRHIKRSHNQPELPRDYICDLCGAAFKHNQTLQQHRTAIHEKLRPHKCDTCGATFGFSSALYTHNKLKHRGETRGRRNAPSTSTI